MVAILGYQVIRWGIIPWFGFVLFRPLSIRVGSRSDFPFQPISPEFDKAIINSWEPSQKFYLDHDIGMPLSLDLC